MNIIYVVIQLSETIVPVSRQAIDDNIRTTMEELQQQLADNQERYKQACIDQITQKEKEITKSIGSIKITENGTANSETNNVQGLSAHSSIV